MRVGNIIASGQAGGMSATARTRSGRAEAANGAPLGIYAKTDSAQPVGPPQVCPESGEVLGELPRDHRTSRAERWALKSVVNRLLPSSRTAKCMRWRAPNQDVAVHKSRTNGRAFYGGLQVCASVWACPVCASKISERRRVELVGAIEAAKRLGLQVYLLTLTVPHGLGDDVREVLDGVLLAWRKTTTSRAGQALRKACGIRGTIRALEVTHGANGFHPHLHVLLFLDAPVSPADVQARFTPLWQTACVKAGLPMPSSRHGCVVHDGANAAAYATKWGLESEMVKGHIKSGKAGGLTPFDFLREVLGRAPGAKRSAALFRVYAEAFKGRRQLYWSNGLRKLLELGKEASDEEVAASQEDSADVLAEVTEDQWRGIMAAKAEADVLTFAEQHPESLPRLLESLAVPVTPPLCAMGGTRPPSAGGSTLQPSNLPTGSPAEKRQAERRPPARLANHTDTDRR